MDVASILNSLAIMVLSAAYLYHLIVFHGRHNR